MPPTAPPDLPPESSSGPAEPGGPRPVDLVVLGEVVTMDADRRIIRDGAVAVESEVIVAVGAAADVMARHQPARVIGHRDHLVTPGYLNGHQHLTGDRLIQSAIPDDLAPGEAIFSWVVPVHGEHQPDDDELTATLTLAESLLHGVTSTFEAGTVAHPLRVAAAADAVGARATIGTWGWDVEEGPFTGSVSEVLARQRDLVAAVQGPRVDSWVSLVGHDLMSDELAIGASDLARELGVGLTFHLSPTTSDPDSYLARTGRRPVVHLDALGVFGDHVVLGHGVHLDDAELDIVVERGVAVVSCPWAYLRLGQGITSELRHLDLWRRGGRLALGCDAENAGDLVDALRAAALFAGLAKDVPVDPTVFGAHDAFELITIAGAAALGVADRVGSIEVGKQADLVVHDRHTLPFVPPSDDPVLQLVWGADGRTVRWVTVAGAVVVDDGAVATIDLAALAAEAADRSRAIMARAGVTPAPRWPAVGLTN